MAGRYALERFIRVFAEGGESYEIGPDAETGHKVEIRYRDDTGKLSSSHRISLPVEVWELFKEYKHELPKEG